MARIGGSGGSGGSRDPFKILRSVRKIIDDMGWQGLGQSAIGTALIAFIFGGIDVFNALLSIPIAAFQTLAELIPMINMATFGGIANFLGTGLGEAANAFGNGWTAILGPLQGPFAVGITLVMLWEVAYYLDYVDSDVIGTSLDVVGITSDESGAAGDKGE